MKCGERPHQAEKSLTGFSEHVLCQQIVAFVLPILLKQSLGKRRLFVKSHREQPLTMSPLFIGSICLNLKDIGDRIMMYNWRTRRGFTLIELLVVVLIIGILASVAWPQYQKVVWKSHAVEAQLNINKLIQAFKLYELSGGEIPHSHEQIHGICNKTDLAVLDVDFTDQVYRDIIVTYFQNRFYGIIYILRYPNYDNPDAALHWIREGEGPFGGHIRCVGDTERGQRFCKILCGDLIYESGKSCFLQ